MAQKIVGRARELEELEEAYASPQPEFLAIYGRRRIGKTFLVVNTLQHRKGIYFHTTGIKKGSLPDQLERFTKDLSRTFYSGVPIETPVSWMKAFDLLADALAREPKAKKIVLFFDELPWMATHKSNMYPGSKGSWGSRVLLRPRVGAI